MARCLVAPPTRADSRRSSDNASGSQRVTPAILPVLADLLGIQIGTAIRWTKLVKADWGGYLAQRAKHVATAT